ncbi:MAG: hypothetical protein SFX72_12465 [Isosphaeraceae bacterium]|nr:hypothetical protein [Isosphaeraceae bacterium]
MTSYLHGPTIDALLARTSSAGVTAWYLTDRLGSVRDLANTSGTVIDHVSYAAFGNILGESNASAGDRFKYPSASRRANRGCPGIQIRTGKGLRRRIAGIKIG